MQQAILVVDDDAQVAESFAMIFQGEGYNVTVAPDGPSAIEAAIARPFDVILLDVILPGMDGRTALECLRTVAPYSSVIVMTGAELEPTEFLDRGASAIVSKPPEVRILLALIHRLAAAPATGRMLQAHTANNLGTATVPDVA
jgi:CheY-like chemotaxis protein